MRFSILTALLTVALVVPNLHAQSNQLEKSQMAVVSYDIRLDKLRDSEMAKTLNLEERIKGVAPQGAVEPDQVKRVFGAMSAPGSIAEVEGMKESGTLPMEMFMRIEFVDSAAADSVLEEIASDGKTEDIGGKTYYRPDGDTAPDNLMAHRVNETMVEFGTDTYLLRADRKVFTPGLKTAMAKCPDEAVRIVIDLAGAGPLVGELQEMAEKNGPPNFAAFYELIGAISDLRLSVDADGASLLTLGVTGKSESQAEDLEGGLGSLIGMGQMVGMGGVGQLKEMNPDLGGMAETILKSLEAKRAEGTNDVEIKLVHPEGLAKAIQGMIGG